MISLWYGENDYAIAREVKLWEGSQPEVVRLDGETADRNLWQQHLTGVSLFAPERAVVIRGASKNKELWDALGELQTDDSLPVIIVELKPDKRTKTFKTFQSEGRVREFLRLDDAALVRWMTDLAKRADKTLEPQSARSLLARCGNDQWIIASEMKKLLVLDEPTITLDMVQHYTNLSPEGSAFALLDAYFANDTAQVADLLAVLRIDEDPYRFIGLIISQVYALNVLVASDDRPESLAKRVGVNPFVLKRLSRVASRMGKDGVSRLTESILLLDRQSKTTGVDPWLLIAIAFQRTA